MSSGIMNDNLLAEVRQVSKQYQTGDEVLAILDGVDLQVAPGDSISITGESGCGKSTLLNMVSGLDRPSQGSVVVDGIEVSRLKESATGYFRSQVLGMVFQSHHLLRDFSLLENVSLPAIIAGESRHAARARAAELLERVGIGGRAEHFPNAVSGGERQRAAVARALINHPRLILADEPTGNLDERHSEGVQDLLFEIVADTNAALLLVTHDRRFAAKASRQFILHRGRLGET